MSANQSVAATDAESLYSFDDTATLAPAESRTIPRTVSDETLAPQVVSNTTVQIPTTSADVANEAVDGGSRFIFTQDNPMNTTILSPERHQPPLYKVETTFTDGTVTRVERVQGGEGEVLAKLFWGDLGYDKIALGATGEKMRLGKVLKSGPFFSETVSFKDGQGRKYEWKGNRVGLHLRLYALDTPGTPIASFTKSRADERTGKVIPAYLTINRRGQEILDMVVWSFCFLEKGKRSSENSYRNVYRGPV
ncbi:hypothetical protein PIIN_02997 [Serendipita indica DSM 11827]|uniref:DUF6593 domain-containing protein n=1 Tax=Serendipita indica (strain DSM 11827) TaxID=1109443 RepID=G4TCQ4_SERID|nr:hypothetical protein PIIN_02997 [Serendipita indica DSM 11827]